MLATLFVWHKNWHDPPLLLITIVAFLLLLSRPPKSVLSRDAITYRPMLGRARIYKFCDILSVTALRDGRWGWFIRIQLRNEFFPKDILMTVRDDKAAADQIREAWQRYGAADTLGANGCPPKPQDSLPIK